MHLARLVAAACLLSLLAPAARADAPPAPLVAESQVQVVREGEGFTIDVVMHAQVPLDLAWAVMTDFDHMAEFIPNIALSQVTAREGNKLQLQQKGQASWGPFTMKFESVREVTLTPQREIRSHNLSGTVKRMDSLMRVEAEPGGTRMHYHADTEPGRWFPPMLGPAKVRQETATQFSALLQEMQRRQVAQAR